MNELERPEDMSGSAGVAVVERPAPGEGDSTPSRYVAVELYERNPKGIDKRELLALDHLWVTVKLPAGVESANELSYAMTRALNAKPGLDTWWIGTTLTLGDIDVLDCKG